MLLNTIWKIELILLMYYLTSTVNSRKNKALISHARLMWVRIADIGPVLIQTRHNASWVLGMTTLITVSIVITATEYLGIYNF